MTSLDSVAGLMPVGQELICLFVTKDTGSPLAGRAMASTPWPLRGQTACGLKPPLHLAPG
jgi:hypothetical protein